MILQCVSQGKNVEEAISEKNISISSCAKDLMSFYKQNTLCFHSVTLPFPLMVSRNYPERQHLRNMLTIQLYLSITRGEKNHPWTFTAYASKLNCQCAVGGNTSFPRISDESVQFDQPLLHCTQAFSNESIQGLNTFHIFVVKYCLIMLQWRTLGCFTSS